MFKTAANSSAMQSVLRHADVREGRKAARYTRAVVSYKIRPNNCGTCRVYRYVEYCGSVASAVRTMYEKAASGLFWYVEVVVAGTPVDQVGFPAAKAQWLEYEAAAGRVGSAAGTAPGWQTLQVSQ